MSTAVPAETARELKERIEAERRGAPFLVYREPDGGQVVRVLDAGRLTVGRSDTAEVSLEHDPRVSRVHAQLERMDEDWILADDGLSRNGSFVNGERVIGRRRLRDGDALRFGGSMVLFRSPGQAGAEETAPAADEVTASDVSPAQRRVLLSLCRPLIEDDATAVPATNKAIAEELVVGVDAVKANLRALFERFDLGDVPQNQKRIRLAEVALRNGIVSARDLE
ncbi:MAG TPA: FHA domain-containing protein [Solirubrobacterales bacterium]